MENKETREFQTRTKNCHHPLHAGLCEVSSCVLLVSVFLEAGHREQVKSCFVSVALHSMALESSAEATKFVCASEEKRAQRNGF